MKLAMTLITAALAAGTAQASGYVGVYGMITKVTMEPNATNPQRLRIEGVFSIRTPDDRGTFQAPQRGFLYYKIPENGDRALTLREWSDLKAAAGTGTVIGFGGSSFAGEVNPAPCLRKIGDEPGKPDPYNTGAGLSKMRSDTQYAPVRAILDFNK